MAKKNKNKFNRPPQVQSQAPAASAPGTQGTPSQQALELFSSQYAELLRDAPVEDVEQLSALPEPVLPSEGPLLDLEKRFRQVAEALALIDSRKRVMETKIADAETRAAAAERRGDELKRERAALDTERQQLHTERQTAEKDKLSLLERDEALVQREADAEAGFLQKREAALQSLRAEIERLTREGQTLQQTLQDDRKKHEQDLRDLRETHAAELHKREVDFDTKVNDARAAVSRDMQALQSRQHQLQRQLDSLEQEKEDLLEERKYLKKRAKLEAARELEGLEAQVKQLEDRLQVARADRDKFAAALDARDQATQQFGGRTPEEILRELHTLRAERDTLREQLQARPSDDTVQRLRLLENERTDWEAKRLQDHQSMAELKQRLERAGIAVTEVEGLRDHKRILETQNSLLRTALRELQADVDKHITSAEGKVVFPACSDLDTREDVHEILPLDDQLGDLKIFVKELQLRMASDETQPLQYSLETLRTFVAGLAMSRLHLLQGISGTGKTSLPLAFARATGGMSALTEVQSGWRDKADLIGHFNAFERRFYESEFLQALYTATLPRYQDIPVMLVLDEMNLSQTEHYFASILSILENPEKKQLILMEAPVSPSPANLREGRMLDLPDNVWFIGTANHDESTKDFADKTYDRAHVMELPRNPASVRGERLQDRQPLSYSALHGAFLDAQARYASEADRAYSFLEDSLGGLLHERFGLNWGNRLERQMKAFVPVMVACGGTVGEATDHILATKILRKVQNQFDVRPDDLGDLQALLRAKWPTLGGQPEHSMRSIDHTLRRLGISTLTA
ncbi:hypothetical protein Dxin01_03819 [Deinococcus xinjiangensis]|uniref:AAA domain (Dynein-related subfamily) n=1 Tax=Deinococcus xinjiangensis TaxID=457454 RepID=A0ABP9VHC3_9DEIO